MVPDTFVSPYVLTWSYGTNPQYHWYVRGIKPDLSFYGEVTTTFERGGQQHSVSGTLTPCDYARFLELVSEIRD